MITQEQARAVGERWAGGPVRIARIEGGWKVVPAPPDDSPRFGTTAAVVDDEGDLYVIGSGPPSWVQREFDKQRAQRGEASTPHTAPSPGGHAESGPTSVRRKAGPTPV